MRPHPKHLDLNKKQGLTVEWNDGRTSFYSVNYLRKWSPSAESKVLREEMAKNPLTVLPSSSLADDEPLVISDVEMVGHYAIRLIFSDGHDTGIYSWQYLAEIDPDVRKPDTD